MLLVLRFIYDVPKLCQLQKQLNEGYIRSLHCKHTLLINAAKIRKSMQKNRTTLTSLKQLQY